MKNILTLILVILFTNCIKGQTLVQAREEFQNENYKKAKSALISIYTTNQSPMVTLYLANNYLKLDDLDSANYYYQLSATGADAYAYLAKARLVVSKENDKALMMSHIDKAISLSKKRDAEVFYQAGFLTYRPKATAVDQFLPFFEEAHRLLPDNDFYTLALGDIYLEQHEGGKAMTKYESVTDKNPENVQALIRIGRLFYSAMNYNKAIEFLEKANAINSSYSIVHKELGELYYITRQYEKASNEYKKYLELNNNDSRAKATYGGFLFQLKEYQKGVDEITPFSLQDSTNFVYHRLLAYCNYEIKQMKNAQAEMNRFWKYADTNKIINLDYIYSGKIAGANGDTLGAVNYLKRATTLDTVDADLQSEYGKALFNAKRNKAAIEAYNRRLLMPQKTPSPLDYYYLGRAYLNNGEFVNADSTFSKFVKLQPKSPDGYLWRAKANVELEDKSNLKGYASPYYLKYIELASGDVVKNKVNLVSAYSYLGYVALAQKDNVKAKEYFTKVLEIDPNNARAQIELKLIK